jgi:hypothetical protein
MWPDMESRQQGCASWGQMLDKFSKYAPAISPLTVAAPAGEGRTATSREVAGRKRYLPLRKNPAWRQIRRGFLVKGAPLKAARQKRTAIS